MVPDEPGDEPSDEPDDQADDPDPTDDETGDDDESLLDPLEGEAAFAEFTGLTNLDLSHIIGKFDTSALMPKIDVSGLMPKFDTSGVLPAFEYPDGLAKSLSRIQANLAEGFRPLQELRDHFSAEFAKFADVAAQMASYLPPNWPDGPDDPGFGDVWDFVTDTRWPIVWVPNATVVTELVQAAPDQREQVLLHHRATILADCRRTVGEFSHPIALEQAPYLTQLLDAADAGLDAPAQALAAVIVTTLLHGPLRYPNLARARLELAERDPGEERLRWSRFALLGSCIPQTLSQFVPAKGDPIPAHFNRHASLHSANPTQYTEANMLLGAILVTAFLREIDELQGNGGWDYLTKRGAPT